MFSLLIIHYIGLHVHVVSPLILQKKQNKKKKKQKKTPGIELAVERVMSLLEMGLRYINKFTLRKHAYSYILKILPPKNPQKILIFFIFLLKT